MRVLMSSPPAIGHVHPMLPLATALVARGHELRWAIGEELCPSIEGFGIRAVAAGLPSQAARHAEFDRRYPEAADLVGEARPDHMFPRLFGAVTAPPMLEDLLAITESWRPDVLVHDAGDLAAPIAAAVLGVPHVTHSFGGAIPPHRLASAREVVAPLWEAHGLDAPPHAGLFEHLYLDICPPSLQSLDHEHVTNAQLLRPGSSDVVGGEALDPMLAEPGPPLVYVTLGTVFGTTAVLDVVLDALQELPVRLLVTVGPRGDPAALGRRPAHVTVARYVPQAELLPHCTAVVSHCGSGTLFGALACGLPHLALPSAADQFRNAEATARTGSGIVLLPGEVTADAVAAAADRLLHDPSLRRGAGAVAAEIAAMPSPDEVAGIVEELVSA